MNKFLILWLMFIWIMPQTKSLAAECLSPVLTAEQIKEIIDKERSTRTDLPKAFPKQGWKVNSQGCYYFYREYIIPEVPEGFHIFQLNRNGVIVDVIGGSMILPRPKYGE